MLASNYPWYEEVTDGTLDQGDILLGCPAGYLPLNWDPNDKEPPLRIQVFDLVVLTQACDLAQANVDYVVCCPVFPHTWIDTEYPGKNTKELNGIRNRIRQGTVPGCAMITAHEGDPSRPVSVVNFRHVFSLPKAFLVEVAKKKHLRLLPPYREHISQGFARFFMRVGLPIEIPSFR